MPETIFRAVMIIILATIPVALGIKDFISPFGFNNRVFVAAGVCFAFILLLGPLWPTDRKIAILNGFFDRRHRASAMAGYFALGASGFFLAWASATNTVHWSRSMQSIYKLFGPAGVASIWVVFGLIGLVGFINVLKNKS